MSRLKSTSMNRVHNSGQRQCDISSWRISRHPTPPAGHRHGHSGHSGHMTQVGGGSGDYPHTASGVTTAGLYKRGRPVSLESAA